MRIAPDESSNEDSYDEVSDEDNRECALMIIDSVTETVIDADHRLNSSKGLPNLDRCPELKRSITSVEHLRYREGRSFGASTSPLGQSMEPFNLQRNRLSNTVYASMAPARAYPYNALWMACGCLMMPCGHRGRQQTVGRSARRFHRTAYRSAFY